MQEEKQQLAEYLNKIADATERMSKAFNRLENQRYFQMVDHPVKFWVFSFLRGMVIGLGSTLGVAIIIGLFIYILKLTHLLPLISPHLEQYIPNLENYY